MGLGKTKNNIDNEKRIVDYRNLGKNTDKAEAKRIMDLAFEAEVNFFDCADAYGGGLVEKRLVSALCGRRQGSIIIRKDNF